ncbi:molybdopterin-guanine dinucleotide biosynthesis protein B [Ottowia thiooxydans]|uniref:molybdopterin-guanine dinucleotide biosynthesis protein B n=1 Tax=Ottowia thiooxydans TaxID=219182 RepID=UPI00040F628A|nr:molybdopterin-guanine dinucleotide biosynthesis protein B [Ottowia thiooxydans]
MKVVCFAGYSGSGKTHLIERLIPAFKRRGLRVSVAKHAHHKFDVDHPGKDSFRHREAGAFEVVVASGRRMALMREFEHETQLSVRDLIAELDHRVDWVFVEGFKHSDVLKIEVWRAASGKPLHDVDDELVAAIATDSPADLPEIPPRPVLDLNATEAVVGWLLENERLFEYDSSQNLNSV